MGYVGVLLLVAVLQYRHAFGLDWLAVGRTQAGLIRQGQWWRAVTALSLHADVAHLASNMVIGGLVGLFVGQLFGSGLAWLSILLAGAAGNLLNALFRPPEHMSVGASTAVFAALGMSAAYAWKRRQKTPASWLVRWAPLIGGVALLGYLGGDGARTDVPAHLMGFFSGVVLGALYGKLGDRVALPTRAQPLLGLIALAVLGIAWVLAASSSNPHPSP